MEKIFIGLLIADILTTAAIGLIVHLYYCKIKEEMKEAKRDIFFHCRVR